MYFTIFLGPLSLGNVIGEQHNGLASTFTVLCSQCNVENTIKTSKEHRSGARGPLTFDVNTRAALGCLHTGVGNTHLNNLLSTLNVPAMNSSTFKNREREAGKAIELVAKNSCQQFLNLEREKAIEKVTSLIRTIWYPLPVLMTWGGRNGGEVSTPRQDMLQSWAFQLERSLTTEQKIKCAAPVMKLKRQEKNQTATTVEKIIQALQSQWSL